MDFPFNIVGSLVPEVAKSTFKQIELRIGYIFHHKRRAENFEKRVEMLKEKRDRVQRDVEAADRNSEKIHDDVQKWLKTVDVILDAKAKEVKDLEGKAEKKCFIGLCPNFKSRYQFSKKAEKYARNADELLERGEFHNVSYRDVPPAVTFAYSKDFEAFDSRKQVLNEILEALRDPGINMIGVYGMAGVGKTTLVKEVARQVKEDKLFDSVVIAAVTQTPDIQKIQDQIADMLGLKFEEQSMTGRASRLCQRLKKEQKILVVLDDIWARLDLMEVGIPSGDEHVGCTLLMTSRDRHVLYNNMNAQKEFQIEVLNPEEAWDLFRKTAVDSELENPDLRSIATQVAEKCGGLPIAISTVARALRKKDLSVWNDALRQLNNPSSSNFSGIQKSAYSAIELSYRCLEGNELKQTFLLCSLLGHNAYIENLLIFAMGLQIFNCVGTIAETRNRLLTLVSHLKASCLLLDSYNNLCFDMHDLVSNVAISIASKENRVFALRYKDVLKEDDWEDGETMKGWDKISLLSEPGTVKLPEQLKCPKLRPKLSVFHAVGRKATMDIPTDFFMEMKYLKVLILTKLDFPILPSSISLLENLRTLWLNQCVLGEIAIIGQLKELEILSLGESDIDMLPKEIGQLIKLKMLDLSDCTKLKKIPPKVLSSLRRLEELYMGGSSVQWEAEGHRSEQSTAGLDELKDLSFLTALDVHIPDARMIPKDMIFDKLQRYIVLIGEAWRWHWFDKIEYSRTLKLKLHTSIGHLNRGMKKLMMKAENLYVDEMKGLELLLQKSEGREYLQQLKNLCIQNGALIQYIIKDNDVDKTEFLQLKSLTLQGLPKLISFCSQNRSSTPISLQGLPLFNEKIVFPKLENLKLSSISIERIWEKVSHSMQNLTSCVVEGCSNLEHVLSYLMVECLQQLKCLEIIDCNSIQEIMETEYGKRAAVSFSRLDSLKLKGLQKLIGFCREDYIVEFPSLTILEIEHCPKLKGFIIDKSMGKDIPTGSTNNIILFNEKVAFPNLEKMTISHVRNVKRIWCNQLHGDSFSKLKELEVEHCDDLLNIFSYFQIKEVFQKLEMVRVADCASLEEVFELQGLVIEEPSVVAIQLREMRLLHLSNMKHVWNKDPFANISFQNLRVVQVLECWSLKSLFPVSIAKGLLHLESLTIYSCGVEEIVSKNIEGLQQECQEIHFQFNQLSFLMLWNLPDLKCFYPEAHTTTCPVLKRLKTWRCGNFKIFGKGESQNQQPLFLIEKVIPQMEEVYFSNDDVAMICYGQYVEIISFSQVKVLGITCFLNESDLFPSYFLQRFQNLEMLEVVDCNFKELSPYEDDVGKKKDRSLMDLPKIKKLKLNGCYKITHLWKQDSLLDHICASLETLEVWFCRSLINLPSTSSSCFQNLKTLDVFKCNGMTELITSSKAQSLVCLVTVKITECDMMTEIVASEEEEVTYEIIFRKLKSLELDCLQSLKSFCSGNYNFKFPSLEQVIVSQCPRLKSFCQGALCAPKLQSVFYQKKTDYKGSWAGGLNATIQLLHEEKVGYDGMKKLKFSEFPEFIDIWNRNPQEILDFTNLEFLEICNSNELRCILNLSMALSLWQLQHIEIKRCNKLEQVINEAEEATPDNKIINIFPSMKSIFVESCPRMTSFYLGCIALVYPSLESIVVVDCPNMTTFVSTFSRGKDKEELIDDGTQRNKYDPNSPTTFFCDKQLKCLEKMDCNSMQELIFTEEKAKAEYGKRAAISFPRLDSLKLKGLDKLIGFSHEDYIVEFPSLTILEIEHCPNLKGFIIDKSMGKDIPTGSTNNIILFNEKVAFPNLEKMTISHVRHVKRIWCSQLHGDSFSKLKELKVGYFDDLLNIFSYFQIKEVFQKLEMLRVTDCASLEEVFELQGLVIEEASIVAIQLREMRLHRLSNMKHVWNKDPPANISFENLRVVELSECWSLKSLFPFPISKGLLHLEILAIDHCGVEEIVSKNIEGLQQEIQFQFNQLSFLMLWNLPDLKCFYTGQHTTAWPVLKNLLTYGCGNIKIFGKGESQIEQPLFLIEKVIPQLEEVYFSNDDIATICNGQHAANFFHHIKVLGITRFPNESDLFPSYFLQRFHNLEMLEVFHYNFEELSSYEDDASKEKDMSLMLQKIKKLKLNSCGRITHIWKQGSLLEYICTSLETLEVWGCANLINLASTSKSLQNLKTLDVWKCEGMTELITSSIAQSLLCLVTMKIRDCEIMTEIVASKEDEATYEIIIFNELKSLELDCLQSLKSFCSGNYSFKFPSLEQVIVSQCPRLKSFCKGALSTPKLQKVFYQTKVDYKGSWAGDLNATIQQLHKEKMEWKRIIVRFGGTWEENLYTGGSKEVIMLPPGTNRYDDLIDAVDRLVKADMTNLEYEIRCMVRTESSGMLKMMIRSEIELQQFLGTTTLKEPEVYVTVERKRKKLIDSSVNVPAYNGPTTNGYHSCSVPQFNQLNQGSFVHLMASQYGYGNHFVYPVVGHGHFASRSGTTPVVEQPKPTSVIRPCFALNEVNYVNNVGVGVGVGAGEVKGGGCDHKHDHQVGTDYEDGDVGGEESYHDTCSDHDEEDEDDELIVFQERTNSLSRMN